MTILRDSRTNIANAEEAKAHFSNLAKAEVELRSRAVRADLRIKRIRDEFSADSQALMDRISSLRSELTDWINTNRGLFERTRTIKTADGKFGLRAIKDLIYRGEDPDKVAEEMMERGYDDCIRRTVAPVKPAIRKRIEDGETFRSCRLRSEDVPVAEVDKGLIADAERAAAAQE